MLQAQQKRLETEQTRAQQLADAASFEVSELDQALSDALLLIDKRLVPYLTGSPTEKRLINLAIYLMLLVSDTGEVKIKPTPLYAELVPLARKLARESGQTGETRPENGRSPAFRGHGLKPKQMAERAGFEPAMEFNPHTRLAGECLQPLGHLSWIGTASLEPRDHPGRPRSICGDHGRVAERLNAAVLKTVRRANPVSGVRIPPLPSLFRLFCTAQA